MNLKSNALAKINEPNKGYIYVDSSFNVFLLHTPIDSMIYPFTLLKSVNNHELSFRRKNKYTTEDLSIFTDDSGYIKKAYYLLNCPSCMTAHKADKTAYEFSVKHITISCCINHKNPSHCCKTLKEMADTSKIYHCVWP
jgi:hypothetical protein